MEPNGIPHLSQREIRCLRVCAELFQDDGPHILVNAKNLEAMAIASEELGPMLRTFEGIGVVTSILESNTGPILSFTVSSMAVQLIREIDAREEARKLEAARPPDFVAQLQARARQNPVLAWIIILGLALTGFFSLVNNIWATIERLVWWFK